ncbi:MAG: methylase [Bacteroidota bacterium]|jgi:hypothetical protein|nr:methylase [Bacteroidota bacterium]
MALSCNEIKRPCLSSPTNGKMMPVLKKASNIVHGNALKTNWEFIVSKNELPYTIGEPPFIGYHLRMMSKKKKWK